MKINLRKVAIYALFVFVGACSEEPIEENSFGNLTGKVIIKGDNTPLPNVKISTTPISTTIFTDAEGNFEFEEIEIGDYSVQAELNEFTTAFEGAAVLAGKTSNIVIELDSLEASNLIPLAPTLLSPEDGTEDIGTEVELVWSSSKNDDDEISYTVELRNGESNDIITYNDIRDTTLVVDNLPIGKNFIWQVSAKDEVNDAVESAIHSFFTKDGKDNRFFYVRNISGNNVIFSGGEPDEDSEEDEFNQNELQLTNSGTNSYRPRKNNNVDKIAFLRSLGGETHLFTMSIDGSGLKQVTQDVPVAGFRQEELEYTWAQNGAKLYYPNFNKLYSINQDGSGNEIIYQVAETVLISEVAVNPSNNLVVIKTNDLNGYNARIVVIDVSTDTEQEVVIEGENGALGGLDFSIDGNRVLFTRDLAGIENNDYRQLDSRIFEYNLTTDETLEINTTKATGTNDLDAKYAPDDGTIIFVNTSNDGISERRVYRTIQDTQLGERQTLFTNAKMPNWE